MLLYTFVISHFSEKARWALDFEGLPYMERRLLPGPHVFVIRCRAPATTVPVLEHAGGTVQGSSAILDYLQERLGARRLAPRPDMVKRSAELEALADQAFGSGIQRIFYDALLPERKTVVDLWSQDGPPWGRAFYAVGYGTVAKAVRHMYKIRPDSVERAKDRFRTAMDEMDRILASRPYLAGDAPTRADVTVAALLAPMCRPPEHVVKWPEAPESLRSFVGEFAGRPIWNHVLKMYREHRRPLDAKRAAQSKSSSSRSSSSRLE